MKPFPTHKPAPIAEVSETDDPLAYGRMLRELTQNLKQRNAAARHKQNAPTARCKKKINELVARLLEQDADAQQS
jgi:hypothetical protein